LSFFFPLHSLPFSSPLFIFCFLFSLFLFLFLRFPPVSLLFFFLLYYLFFPSVYPLCLISVIARSSSLILCPSAFYLLSVFPLSVCSNVFQIYYP
jgi:hypothetical protein